MSKVGKEPMTSRASFLDGDSKYFCILSKHPNRATNWGKTAKRLIMGDVTSVMILRDVNAWPVDRGSVPRISDWIVKTIKVMTGDQNTGVLAKEY